MRTSTIKNKRTGQTRKKVERSNKLSSVFGFAVIGILGFIIHTNYAAISVINTFEDTSKLFSLLTPSHTGIDFENKVVEGPDRGMQFYDYFYKVLT